MKNAIKQILNGVGTGIGLGLVVLAIFVVTQIIEQRRYTKYYNIPTEKPEELISEKGDLVADNSTTDRELMEVASGHWWGISWNPISEELYSISWYGTKEGEHTLDFNIIKDDDDPTYTKESGIWWIKKPFYHTETEDFEETYRILYLSKDYFVYQQAMTKDRPIPNGQIFIKSRVPSLIENLEILGHNRVARGIAPQAPTPPDIRVRITAVPKNQ